MSPSNTPTSRIIILFNLKKSILTWKHPKYPSIGEWINKLCCIHSVEYYSALKRTKLSSPKKAWGNPTGITKWKKPIRKRLLCAFNYTAFQKRQNYVWKRHSRIESKKISCQGWGKDKAEQVEYRGFLEQWNYSVWFYKGGYMPLCIC